MVTHMKTTVELAPDLLELAKKRAIEQGVTFKVILETALWQMLKTPPKRRRRKMKDCSVKGQLQPGVDLSNWEQMRSIIYEGHGG